MLPGGWRHGVLRPLVKLGGAPRARHTSQTCAVTPAASPRQAAYRYSWMRRSGSEGSPKPGVTMVSRSAPRSADCGQRGRNRYAAQRRRTISRCPSEQGLRAGEQRRPGGPGHESAESAQEQTVRRLPAGGPTDLTLEDTELVSKSEDLGLELDIRLAAGE